MRLSNRARYEIKVGNSIVVLLMSLLFCVSSFAQTTVFTYQGKLNDGGAAANGSYDMQFKLFDDLTGNGQVGSTAAGIFTVELDFGSSAFAGAARFLEIGISPAGQGNFTTLSPRQRLGSSPYSIKSINSGTADNALSLGGTTADQFVVTDDPRMTDARTPLPGSSDYVQSGTTTQPNISFNIGGTGTASVFNAATQYNLGGNRFLFGNPNGLFLGIGAGGPTTATGNVFVGAGAGTGTTSGPSNSFFGQAAGRQNTTGGTNTFVGFAAGFNNTTGNNNIFIGSFAGNPTPTTQVNNSIAIGNNVTVSENNTIAIGNINQKTLVDGRFRTGIPFGTSGADLPGRGYMETFHVSDTFQGIYTPNVIFGSFTSNPRNSIRACVHFQGITGHTAGVILTNCTSALSSERDKTEARPFTSGLDVIERLRPVSFRHKENGKLGIGLNSEDVAEIEPSLIQRDDGLAIESVNETSLSMLLINAVKEQQLQIETQQEQIRQQQVRLDALTKLVCSQNSQNDFCKEQ